VLTSGGTLQVLGQPRLELSHTDLHVSTLLALVVTNNAASRHGLDPVSQAAMIDTS
jgi:hypothetical protein